MQRQAIYPYEATESEGDFSIPSLIVRSKNCPPFEDFSPEKPPKNPRKKQVVILSGSTRKKNNASSCHSVMQPL